MTPEQIKAAARQAGGITLVGTVFSELHLSEFVRLIRQQAFEEAAKACDGETWVIGPQRKSTHMETFNKACDNCAKAIRGLV